MFLVLLLSCQEHIKLTVKLICKIALMYARYYVWLLRTHLSTLGLKQRALTKGVSTTVPLVSSLTLDKKENMLLFV